MLYRRLLAALLVAGALAGCSTLQAGAGSSSTRSFGCTYSGASPECRGLHTGG
jgi:hypothetical protein